MAKLTNSLAMQRMLEKDQMTQMDRVNTKQKRGTPTFNLFTYMYIERYKLQSKVLYWIMDFIEEKPKRNMDYDNWIADGSILSKVLQHVIFNSVPKEGGPTTILETKQERVDILLKYLRKYGVPEEYLFKPEELLEMKNIPKGHQMYCHASKNCPCTPEFDDLNIEIPSDDDLFKSSDDECD
ncbi:TAGLN [Lepeophtheirus salmonis]|uniref:TAGLN n=1 Tax=Lepeophtheirus salmonis TaxID=72036 RepID=A0A7R8CDI1_LEPSM|nr:TAGLN [Lepeophtheirus salmonis]CAF2749680.1 TAGLN [Lepeophtheirus salmonis]